MSDTIEHTPPRPKATARAFELQAQNPQVQRLWISNTCDQLRRDAAELRRSVKRLAADLRNGRLASDTKRAKAVAQAADELAEAVKLDALADELEGSR